MPMSLANVKQGARYCAFCRHWYDPTNSAIVPVNPKSGFWRYNTDAKALCALKVRQKMPSWASCVEFERKV